MADNRFKIKNGLVVEAGGSEITGSLVAPSITGSLFGTASWAQNAVSASSVGNLNQSLVITGSVTISGSAVPELFVLGDQQITGSLRVTNGVTAQSVSASFTGSLTGALIGTASWSNNAITASYVTGSIHTAGNLALSSSYAISASNSVTASYVTGSIHTAGNLALSASNALTASFAFTASVALNAVGSVGGSGTPNRITKFSTSTTLTDSGIFDDGTNIQISGSNVSISGSNAALSVTGSIRVLGGGITGSLLGTSSWSSNSVSASYVTGSIHTAGNLALSASYAISASNTSTASFVEYSNVANKPTLFSGSSQVQLNGITGTTFAAANFTFPQDLIIQGNLTAQQFIVSSSVAYITTSFSSGSTTFGNSLDDTHRFTGSLFVSNSVQITGSLGISGNIIVPSISSSLFGTASWSNNSITASYVTGSIHTAGNLALSASNAITASYSLNGGVTSFNTRTGAVTLQASDISGLGAGIISSSAFTASWASNSVTASYVTGSIHTTSNPALSASYAVTASYALNVTATSTGANRKLLQSIPSTTWSFNHNLGERYPVIETYDTNGASIIPGRIETVDTSNLFVYFDVATAGTVVATVGGIASTTNADTASYVNGSIFTESNPALSASYALTASYALNAGGGTGVGFPYTGSAQITGSLGVTGSVSSTGGFTGSLFGTASYVTGSIFTSTNRALSASFAISSSNSQTASFVDYVNVGNKPTLFSGSSQVQLSQITGTTFADTLYTFPGDVIVQGNVTAEQLIISTSVYFVTTSFSSGSTIFGNSLDDTHRFTGSLFVSNSLQVTGSVGVTGAISAQSITASLFGTASYVTGSIHTAGNLALSASYSVTSSYSVSSSNAATASYVTASSIVGNIILGTQTSGQYASTIIGGSGLTATTAGADDGTAYTIDAVAGAGISLTAPTNDAINIDTGSAHFTGGVKNKNNTDAVLSGSVSSPSQGTISVGGFTNISLGLQTTSNVQFNQITASIVSASQFTGSLLGTASYVTGSIHTAGNLALSASYAISSSVAQTASFVNTLNQTVTITGSLIVSNSVNVIGTERISGSLIVSGGAIILIDGVVVSGSLTVTGSTTLIGNTQLTGGLLTSGAFISELQYIDFVTSSNPPHREGRVHFTEDTKTIQVDTDVANFMIELGHQQVLRVRNENPFTLNAGKIVYISGSSGNRPLAQTSSIETDTVSAATVGMVAQPILTNNNGYVITRGTIRDINTTAYLPGTPLYLSTSGDWSSTPPEAPLHEVRIGKVVTQAVAGAIYIDIMNGYEIGELHDVVDTNGETGDLLVRSGSSPNNVFKNSKQLTGSYGVTGSWNVLGNVIASTGVTASLLGTASFSTTASYVTGSIFVAGNLARSSSYTLTANNSLLLGGGNAGSFISTASFGTTQTISGSLIINQDLTVLGSSSILYVTSSQLNISTNIITVNTQNPTFRFGGLAVIDSGSIPQQSGSILYDSVQDEWIFVHRGSGTSGVTSSHFLVGPETYNNLGNETYVANNVILKSQGNEHVTGSNITDDGTNIYLVSNTQITGSLNVRNGITGSLLGTASYVTGSIHTAGNLALSASYALTSAFASNAGVTSFNTRTGAVTLQASDISGLAAGIISSSAFTASWAQNAVTASYVTGSVHTSANPALSASYALSSSYSLSSSYAGSSLSASFASTSSFVNTLNQNVLITGSLTIGSSSIGSNENTLVLGPPPAGGAGEGGQLLLQAQGGTYTSASMWDNWQNYTRLLRGTNVSSDAVVAQFNMHSKQIQFPAYNSLGAFSGTAVAALGINSTGEIITIQTGSQTGGSGVTINNNTDNYLLTATGTANTINGESNLQFNGSTLSVTGNVTATSITASGAVIAQANNQMYFRGGDDAELWDINIANTVGVYGQQDQGVGSIKLGSGGGTLAGRSGSIGIGTIAPSPATNLDVVGVSNVSGALWVTGSARFTGSVSATQGGFTGSLFGTASWANNSVTASYVTGSIHTAGNLALSASNATTASFAFSQIKYKSNAVAGGTFAGNPRKATVTFTTAFPDTNYSVTITGEDSRTWTIESKLAGSFVINSNSNTNLAGNIYWIAMAYGETV